MGSSESRAKFTYEEIAKHNTSASVWIICDGRVYDVTPLLPTHPGGEQALLRRGGGVQDCRRDYDFHSRKGRQEWSKYLIGEVDAASARCSPPKPVSPVTEAPMREGTSGAAAGAVCAACGGARTIVSR